MYVNDYIKINQGFLKATFKQGSNINVTFYFTSDEISLTFFIPMILEWALLTFWAI